MPENNNEIEMQQNVPGKQLTLNHMIVEPESQVMSKLNLEDKPYPAIGIVSVTPGDAAIIAADTAVKYTNVNLEGLNNVTGTVIVGGDIESVMNSLNEIKSVLCDCMGFAGGHITMT